MPSGKIWAFIFDFFFLFLEASPKNWSSFLGVIRACQIFRSKLNSFYLHTSHEAEQIKPDFSFWAPFFKSSVWNASVHQSFTESLVCRCHHDATRQRNIKLILCFYCSSGLGRVDLCASRFERRLTTVTVWKTGWEAFQVWCFIQASGWLKVWLENKTGEK